MVENDTIDGDHGWPARLAQQAAGSTRNVLFHEVSVGVGSQTYINSGSSFRETALISMTYCFEDALHEAHSIVIAKSDHSAVKIGKLGTSRMRRWKLQRGRPRPCSHWPIGGYDNSIEEQGEDAEWPDE